ncbi:outer dense fiber protein 2 [Spea bombifrons]|uniref:outer dense fiber protein 2 n=1 Tax=Spea bombifrons TaxID=233779 RepID=UPI00234B7D37|nr:outer dense fiber protein 2 [Spea bombifrons]
MKSRSPSPPLHLHVDENTPVHVHIEKGHKATNKLQDKPSESKMRAESANLRRTKKIKTKVPWIPPGKTSAHGSGLKWEGITHRLDITPPDTEKMVSALRLSDLSTEGGTIHRKINTYEKKIDSLVNKVETLKHEVELKKKEHVLERYEGKLSASKKLLEEQKDKLAKVSLELEETEHENARLKMSIERINEEKDLNLLQKQQLQEEKCHLLSKLMEAEMDGSEAAKQVGILRDTVDRMKYEKRMSSTDVSLLTRQKEILLQKLSTFEGTNKALRTLLREQHCRETEKQQLLSQIELLMKKLSDSDTEKTHLQLRLYEKEKEVDDLLLQLQTEKDKAQKASELSKSLDATKAHLQGQLRSREAENNRLTVQLKNLERAEVQHKIEMEKTKEHYNEMKQKVDSDKDALKKSARALKQRAERSEETVQTLNAQLAEKNAELARSLSDIDNWKSRHSAFMKDKSEMEKVIGTLNNRITELLEEIQINDEKSRLDQESLMDKLHQQNRENTFLKLEHEKLKSTLATAEEKLAFSHNEVQQLKSSLHQYEGLVDTYKDQVEKARMEAREVCKQLDKCDKETKTLETLKDLEVEEVRRSYHASVEMVKQSERKLQDCQELLLDQERKNIELTRIISDMRTGMEKQGEKVLSTREKYQSALEENHRLVTKLADLERKLDDAGIQQRDLMQIVAKQEESLQQGQWKLEEKNRECAALARQLNASIEESCRQVNQARESVTSKERATQSKILDLETQLSRTKAELNQIRRTKDDTERRFQSRLQDLKDRLEQSESTNRSMQNYVQFLKSSYSNVFGEAAFSSTPIHPQTPI